MNPSEKYKMYSNFPRGNSINFKSYGQIHGKMTIIIQISLGEIIHSIQILRENEYKLYSRTDFIQFSLGEIK